MSGLLQKIKNALSWISSRPAVLISLLTLILLSRVLLLGQLVYGDIPAANAKEPINFLYAWDSQQFGTNIRQGFNTIRDELFHLISVTNYMFYFLTYILPLLLIPLTYFWILRKLGLRKKIPLIIASLAPLFTPVVFGDFLSGQTFWIYLTLPWVFYFAIRIFCLGQFKLRNYILLAVWLFLSLGALPPIIVPLMVILAIMVLAAFVTHRWLKQPKIILHFVIASLSVGIFFLLLSVPYLFAASSGQAAYTPASLLGDYYHNYSGTDFINTLRLAGNNGDGQSTLGYNTSTITDLFGYVILAGVIIGSFIIGVEKRPRAYKLTSVSLLAPLLAIFCFLSVMSTDPLVGTSIFQSQWIVSTIRNPSKLYVIMLPLFSILFAFALENFTSFTKVRWQKVSILGILVISIGIYGWPTLRGDLGLFYHRENKVASYKANKIDQTIASKVPSSQRSLLVPANHTDELNYENLNTGFDILQLQGGLPTTTQYVKQLNSAINGSDNYFFKYLDAAGVNNVFAKTDQASYTASMFDLFPVKTSPQQTQQFLQGGLEPTAKTADYTQYANKNADPLVYSPSQIINVKGQDSLQTKAPFLGSKIAVISNDTSKNNQAMTTSYGTIDNLANNTTIAEGKAQLHDPQLIVADIYGQSLQGKQYVVFDILNPLTYRIQSTQREAVPNGTSVIILGNTSYAFTSQKKRITIRAGDYQAAFAKQTPVRMGNEDPSFEKSIPKVTDATPTQKGKPSISVNQNSDASSGSHSLEISSQNHTAFVTMELPITDASKQYLLSFDYKNITGQAPSFNVVQGDEPLLYSGGALTTDQSWQTHQQYFSIDSQSNNPSSVTLYLYTSSTNGQLSQNLFDNIKLYSVDQVGNAPLKVANYASDYDLTNYTYIAPLTDTNQNLLSNPSFENASLWGNVGDATAGATGEAHISATQSGDAEEGSSSLDLQSSGHTAYVAKTISHYDPNVVYKLSFYYKHISGQSPTFAVWQDGSDISQPSAQLSNGSGWQYYETYFVPDPNTSNMTLYFYSPSLGDKTENLFDNVTLEPTALVSTYLEKQTTASVQPTNLVKSYNQINPTLMKVTVSPGSGMVVFNESFSKSWNAFVIPSETPDTTLQKDFMFGHTGQKLSDHIMVNDLANGWWINTNQLEAKPNADGTYTIVLQYTPQTSLYKGFVISSATAILMTGYICFDSWFLRRKEVTK